MAVMSRLSRLVRGFFGLFISGLEESNPEALMEAARQDFRDKMAQYNLALAQMAGVAERLKNQIKSKTARAQELERRILANHQAGNLELAGTLARELQELKADLTTTRPSFRKPRMPIRETFVRQSWFKRSLRKRSTGFRSNCRK